MEQQPTCGQGIAYHASFPAKLADVLAAIAANLEAHLTAIDPKHAGSRAEFNAYIALATEHRELESRLRALALEMEGCRDLPMAEHDMTVMTSPRARDAFAKLVSREQELLTLLTNLVQRHRAML